MKTQKFSLRLTKKMYAAVRLLVRLLSGCIVLLVCAFVFLRLFGVPEPILREMVKRVNLAGIPVDVEHVELTLRGWRALNVSYYSKHPDDLTPIFFAREVLFSRTTPLDADPDQNWFFDIIAMGISLNPSVVWGVDIPVTSQSRTIDRADLSLVFSSDRIESRGSLTWLGARFNVHGTVLKSDGKGEAASVHGTPRKVERQCTVLPKYISAAEFKKFEDHFNNIQLNNGADIDIGFFINSGNYADSRFDINARASNVSVYGLDFSLAELKGSYSYPQVVVDHASLSYQSQVSRLSGSYNLDSKLIRGELYNGITSKDLFLLMPQVASELLEKEELHFEYLPQVTMQFGPAQPGELLNSLDGSFAIREVSYCGLVVDSLRGQLARKNNRLDLTQLQGSVIGQEDRATKVGSCMTGGSATGEVFWDAASEEFGVKASGSLDPNLVIDPLARVQIATNVINRFKFESGPPHIDLELGARYTDWRTFFINIHGVGDDVQIHEGRLSSVNTSGYYKHGVLKLDPIAAMQGADFLKGTASLDFLNSSASFDVRGSINPETIEDAIYPELNLFGNKIRAEGSVSISTRGLLDWGRMKKTDFTAEVEADRFEIPVATVNSFTANVSGAGAEVSVNDAEFLFHDGQGKAAFTVRLDPSEKGMPYAMNIGIGNADFNKYLRSVNPKIDEGIAGRLSGSADFDADFSKDFFESANGTGKISVEEGQLADLPLFRGFSKLIRKVIPGFNIFSITSLKGTFQLIEGEIHSTDAFFEGDVISAKGTGKYTKSSGFDALVKAQIMNDNAVSKVIQVITSPIFNLFELKLEGPLSAPVWKLEKFQSDKQDATEINSSGNSR